MRQVRGEIRELKEILGDDVRFSEVKFLVSTANMGKNLYVDGTVADDETLADLRDLIEGEVAGKFSVVYWVKIKKDGD